ncbi:hypothetical protein PPERSA_10519 [Pseudocohnilembus persalinus]|uniref:Uncharacterized protein n=1 Tax=Pseudocohnilembus persalinus TaxID=266149 RepID=A0A0V0R7E3_PSEPJ|nr:hypothetical protein PPERSA_10519 [Pseudocohnilembus persalinus]|eukprot:KRX10420.1 hypothetical protein PPERSA_10519 [Pseudocohnilembus persalinus]
MPQDNQIKIKFLYEEEQQTHFQKIKRYTIKKLRQLIIQCNFCQKRKNKYLQQEQKDGKTSLFNKINIFQKKKIKKETQNNFEQDDEEVSDDNQNENLEEQYNQEYRKQQEEKEKIKNLSPMEQKIVYWANKLKIK